MNNKKIIHKISENIHTENNILEKLQYASVTKEILLQGDEVIQVGEYDI